MAAATRKPCSCMVSAKEFTPYQLVARSSMRSCDLIDDSVNVLRRVFTRRCCSDHRIFKQAKNPFRCIFVHPSESFLNRVQRTGKGIDFSEVGVKNSLMDDCGQPVQVSPVQP